MRLALFTAGLLVVTPAFANESAPAPKPDDAEKVVCKKQRPTGSHLPVRVCLTRAQWEELSAASQRGLKDATARPSTGEAGGGALPTPQ